MEAKRSFMSKLALIAAAGLFAGTTVSCQSGDAEEEANDCSGNDCSGNDCSGNDCSGDDADG